MRIPVIFGLATALCVAACSDRETPTDHAADAETSSAAADAASAASADTPAADAAQNEAPAERPTVTYYSIPG